MALVKKNIVDPQHIPFGVELETTIPTRYPVGTWSQPARQTYLPTNWKSKTDSSIRSMPSINKGAEMVSDKMSGVVGLESITEACDKVKAIGGRVNGSCGCHISVSFGGNMKALGRLMSLVGNHEKALYAVTGTKSRERGYYANPVKECGKVLGKHHMQNRRTSLLNLTHWSEGGNNRVEFRVFSGSLNDDKIRAWTELCLALVCWALENTRELPWDYAPKSSNAGPWNRDGRGEGEAELHRLFYRLGWTKGHRSSAAGLLIPSNVKAYKKTLVAMAKKYDADAR